MTTQKPATPVDVDIVLFKVCLLALLTSFALFVLGIGVIYIGDEYAVPAWSESSFPPPAPPYAR